MIRYLLVISSLLFVSFSSHAQIRTFDPNTLFAAARCELGQWAQSSRYQASSAGRQKALIKIEGSEVRNTAVGLSFQTPFPQLPSFGFSYTPETTRTWDVQQAFNIHRDNSGSCARNRPVVGVRDCFQDQGQSFLGGASFRCSVKVSANAQGNLKGAFPAWFLNVGPSGSISYTRTFTVSLAAPDSYGFGR